MMHRYLSYSKQSLSYTYLYVSSKGYWCTRSAAHSTYTALCSFCFWTMGATRNGYTQKATQRHLADLNNGDFLVISLINFGICDQHTLAAQIKAGGFNFSIWDSTSPRGTQLVQRTARLRSLRSPFDSSSFYKVLLDCKNLRRSAKENKNQTSDLLSLYQFKEPHILQMRNPIWERRLWRLKAQHLDS